MSHKKNDRLVFRGIQQAGSASATAVKIASDQLASGADGKIYLLDGLPQPAVAKLYHPERLDNARRLKLEAMLGNAPDLPDIELGGHRYVQLAWPLGLLFEKEGVGRNSGHPLGHRLGHRSGHSLANRLGKREADEKFVGFAMPAVDLKRSTTLETLLSEKTRKAYRLPNHYGYQVAAARNVAVMIAELHAHGHHVIDLKPVNINVYTDKLFIAMLDCDGFSVLGGVRGSAAQNSNAHFPAHQYTADYIAPEAWRTKQPPEQLGEAQDRFALAVILFRLINRGLHPFQGVPDASVRHVTTNQDRIAEGLYAYGQRPHRQIQPSPWSIHQQLPKVLRDLFDQAFTSQRRPSAAHWAQALAPFVDAKSGELAACPQNSDHGVFAGLRCGHCEVEQRRVAVSKPSRRAGSGKKVQRRNRGASARRAARANVGAGPHTRATVGQAWQGPPGTTSGVAGATATNPPGLSDHLRQLRAAIGSAFTTWQASGPSRWFVPLMPLLLMAALLLHQNRSNLADWWAVKTYQGNLSQPAGRVENPATPLSLPTSGGEAPIERQSALAKAGSDRELTAKARRLIEWQAAIDAGNKTRFYELAYQRNRQPLQANSAACCESFVTPEASGLALELTMLPTNQRLPLHYAVERGVEPQLIALLLSLGFSATEQDADGYTPIQLAAYFGRLNALKVLLKNNNDPNELTAQSGPLPSAVQAVIGPANSKEKVDEILALLTEKGMNTSGNRNVVFSRTPEYYSRQVDWGKRNLYAAAR